LQHGARLHYRATGSSGGRGSAMAHVSEVRAPLPSDI
jgi:hypothetical protein